MIYNMSGIPCSDELYHHGILGQKWGVRRYQNPDGTLTAAGKVHYAATKTGEVIGSAAKKVSNKIAASYKNKHPKLLTDEELQARISRISMENRYRDLLRENQRPISKGSQMAQDILERSGKDLASGLVNLSTSILREKAMSAIRSEEKEKEDMAFKLSPAGQYQDYFKSIYTNDMSDDDVKKAADRADNLRKIMQKGNNKGKKG